MITRVPGTPWKALATAPPVSPEVATSTVSSRPSSRVSQAINRAMKRAPNRIQLLKAVYEEEFERAMQEDRDRASFNVVPQYQYFRSV